MTTQIEVAQEIDRRKSQTAKLLEAFQKHGELTTKDLMRIGTGCSSRLHELRTEGHKIVAVRECSGFYRYVYLGQQSEDDPL